MSYQAPGMLDAEEAVDRKRARTEVLARAFDDAAGGYFNRQKRYEDNISEAEDNRDQMKLVGIGAVVAGFVFVVVGIGVIENLIVSVLGFLAGAAVAAYAYTQYQDAEERIEENERDLRANEPDGEVTFVSQIGVPMYLVPYKDDHMVFDGLDTAPERTLDLAKIDADALLTRRDALDEQKDRYDDILADETIVSPDHLMEFAPDAGKHRQLERPLLERIDAMTSVASDIERDMISASVCANDQKSRSIASLARLDLLDRGDLTTVETRKSMSECEAVVDDIRGVEEQAISGDMLDQAQECRDHVDSVTTELKQRLLSNEHTVTDHYDAYAETMDTQLQKHVCEECLAERVEAIVDELGLVDQILSSEAGSLGMALSDDDLNRGIDEEFTARIRSDIKDAVPSMDAELKRAYNRLDALGPDSGYCPVHGDVETVPVADSGTLFGEVWRSLYYAFREPIMDSVGDLEQEAEEIRQTKEQKMVDLTQYEQIKDEAEQRYFEVKSDYEAARKVEESLR